MNTTKYYYSKFSVGGGSNGGLPENNKILKKEVKTRINICFVGLNFGFCILNFHFIKADIN